MTSVLDTFHPTISSWFKSQFAAPTNVQERTWPVIAAGNHVLATAPTGSGKTLTAFLWSLHRFANGDWNPGQTRVVYISPLKALNNDIQRNLLAPLGELKANHDFPDVSVRTRSGDTSQGDRQRMLRKPPDILITTPESLALLLTTTKGRLALATVETLILDEVHAVVGNRRGVQLMTSVERLAHIAGEFQRIALSATVRPLEPVAAYIGGYQLNGTARAVTLVTADQDKDIRFRVRFPEDARNAAANGKKIWDPLSSSFRDLIAQNRSTLFFTNSRRLAEKITLKINEDQPAPIAYAHHGSLAKDIRTEVESRLKAGELKAIVATSSLEMGIDVGHLDEVVMVQSPPSVAATLQRIGRAGHRVGEVSQGTLYPTHAQDFLEAAVLATAVRERDIEPLTPLQNPLDVLCQVIVSMCANETWEVDAMFELIRASAPYHELPRERFDLIVDMLAGRYAGSRVRELKPRLAYDRINQTVKAHKSAVFALYNSGGTIPDRGYYKLRHADSGTVIGELDEEFVWEATTGQTFTLGTQNWQILRITHNDVMVRAAKPGSTAPPFWRSESFNRSFYFSERIAQYLEMAENAFQKHDEQTLQAQLTEQACFDAIAAEELIDYLARQREVSQAPLPHRHHVLVELVHSGPAGYSGPDLQQQLVIHTFWGGQLNRPWALALEAAWRARYDTEPEIHADNNAVVVQLKQHVEPTELLTLVTPHNLETHLRESLEGSGYFGARFRECAGRSLLLTKQRFDRRLPLWMSRLQAKKLMTATKQYDDFPVLLETWRTCLVDEFDLPALNQVLEELQDGTIDWTLVNTTTPSPFASNVTFDQVSRYMYADDTPERGDSSAIGIDLIRSAVFNQALRPPLHREVIDAFEAKRQRRAPGYVPRDIDDWLEWAKERVLVPLAQWPAEIEHEQLIRVTDGRRTWVAHLEIGHGLLASELGRSLTCEASLPAVPDTRTGEQLSVEILSFYGPLSLAQIETLLPEVLEGLLEDEEQFVTGELIDGDATTYICDADNVEILLRFQRAASRADVVAKPLTDLPGYLAAWQGLGQRWSDHGGRQALDQLSGYPAPVSVWLGDFMQARFTDFADYRLDELFTQEQLTWLGTGNQQVTLCYPDEVELHRADAKTSPLADYFNDPNARYSYFQIKDQISGPAEASAAEFNDQWWSAVWRGELGADTLSPLRLGLIRNFQLADGGRSSHPRRRARANALGWPGNWHLTPTPDAETDPLQGLEDAKDSARALLERFGFINRELANREARWGQLFKALRVMELAGEVIAGYFFEGLSGPQFMTPRGLNRWQNYTAPESFWVNATDPVAPCGLSLDWDELPQRRPGNYLSFFDNQLALAIENSGSRLHFYVPPEHPAIDEITAPLQYLVRRERRVTVTTINSLPAKQSPYLESLDRTLRRVTDHKQIYFEAI